MKVRMVTAGDTAALRRAVLRDGRDHPPLGDRPENVHVGVYDGDRLVATGNVGPEAASGVGGWRVRGMATDPDYRGRGAGTQVLDALLDHVARHGGGTVWCQARTPARRLYERAGFTVEGEPWDDPDIGPHVRMTRNVDPAPSRPSSP